MKFMSPKTGCLFFSLSLSLSALQLAFYHIYANSFFSRCKKRLIISSFAVSYRQLLSVREKGVKQDGILFIAKGVPALRSCSNNFQNKKIQIFFSFFLNGAAWVF